MERWDFDCQSCGKGIYHSSAIKNENKWHECPNSYDGKHEIKGAGPRGGYSFCAPCAEKIGYTCPVCGSNLEKKRR